MDLEKIIIAIIFIIYGVLNAVNPKAMFNLRANLSQKLLGVKYTATQKTYRIFRLFGILMVAVGILLLAARTI